MGVNNAKVIGHLGADPEVRTFDDGGKVANFSVATSDKWKDKNTGEPREHTEWHRIVLRNGLASVAEQYLRKGSQLYVEGKMRTRSYQKDGIDHYVTEIIGSEIKMLGGANGGNNENQTQTTQPQSQDTAGKQQAVAEQAPPNSSEATSTAKNPDEPFTGDVSDEIPF